MHSGSAIALSGCSCRRLPWDGMLGVPGQWVFWSPSGRGSLVLRLGRVSIPAAVLSNLCGSVELFQALRLDGNSFGRERQGSGPEGRPTFWEARRVGDARVAGRDPLGGLLVGEPLPC